MRGHYGQTKWAASEVVALSFEYVLLLNQIYLKNCITLLKDFGLVLVTVVLILIPPQILCLKRVF